MLFVVGAAWMGPVDAKSSWMIPLAAAVLLLPCFFRRFLLSTGFVGAYGVESSLVPFGAECLAR